MSFQDFLTDPNSKGKKTIDEFGQNPKNFIVFSLDDLQEFDTQAWDSLVKRPIGAYRELKSFETFVTSTLGNIEVGFNDKATLSISKLHDLGSAHVGRIVKVRGLVNRVSQIHPLIIEGHFVCRDCGLDYPQPIIQDNLTSLTIPTKKCSNCGCKYYDVVPEESKTVNSQDFSIQESYEDVSSRGIPTKIPIIIIRQFLINKVNCGDLVEIIGLVRLAPLSQNRGRTRKTIPYIEVIGLTKKSKDPEQIEVSPAEEMEICELASQPDIYEKLVKNVAPSIYGLQKEKEAALLAMVGGVDRKTEINMRGNIHVLLVGDPSTAKSQLLRAVAELAPRAMYATGRGTTAAGLTASMNKDDNGEWVIDAGVLVLADKGVACIDEIDKMRNEDRVNIHEAMEQQTVSIDKAGVHATLMARTSIIAAANPLTGRYDSHKTVLENLSSFPPSLFSRFDLIFVVLDEPNKNKDLEVIKHILETGKSGNINRGIIDRDLFKKYIAYSKRVNPSLSKEAEERLMKYFMDIRNSITDTSIPIFFRQFEALRRLCEAHARILMRKEALIDDANASIEIFNEFLKSVKFDIESLETQKPKCERDRNTVFFDVLSQYPHGVHKADFLEELEEKGVDKGTASRMLAKMLSDGIIFEAKEGFIQKV